MTRGLREEVSGARAQTEKVAAAAAEAYGQGVSAVDEIAAAQDAAVMASTGLTRGRETVKRLVLKLANQELGFPSSYVVVPLVKNKNDHKILKTTTFHLYFLCAETGQVIPYEDGGCFTFEALTREAASSAHKARNFWTCYGPALRFSAGLLVDMASAGLPLPLGPIIKALTASVDDRFRRFANDLAKLNDNYKEVASEYHKTIATLSGDESHQAATSLLGTKCAAFSTFLRANGFDRNKLAMELKKLNKKDGSAGDDWGWVLKK